MVLLSCAGLFVRSLDNLRDFNTGFDAKSVSAVQLFPLPSGYKNIDNLSYYSQLLRSSAEMTGVQGAALTNFVPGWTGLPDEGVAPAADSLSAKSRRAAKVVAVSPGFFNTLKVSLLRGRDFGSQDTENTPHVAIMSQQLADQLFGSGNALERSIHIGSDPKSQDFRVIAIANNAYINDIRSPELNVVYTDVLQQGDLAHWGNLLIRTTETPASFGPHVRRQIYAMGHEYVFGIRTLQEANEQALLNQRMTSTLSEVFGGLDVLLAAVGLYGVMTFMVARRTQEIGIRMALGALPGDVLRMIMGKALLLVGIGIAIGTPCSLVANRLVAHLLFGLSPADPLVLAGVTALLFVTALVASYLPAYRATQVDPMVSLRQC